MKGFLMQQQTIVPGEDVLIESFSSEGYFGVVFESNEETGYFYAIEKTEKTREGHIVDALHVYETAECCIGKKQLDVKIIWSKDWKKAALVLDDECHAVFDFEKHAGYNLNEFPPPNSIWTMEGRKLTNQIIEAIFK